MATFELDVYDLSSSALKVVRAAVKYARRNSSVEPHVMPLNLFYRLAGLDVEMSLLQFMDLLKEIRHTSIFSTDFEPAALRGWSVFEHLVVTGTHLEFAVCCNAFDATDPMEFLPADAEAAAYKSSSATK